MEVPGSAPGFRVPYSSEQPGCMMCQRPRPRDTQLSTHQFPSRVRQSAFRGMTCRFWHNDLKAVCRRRRFSSANAAFDTTFRKLRALSGVSRADMPLLTLHSAFRVPKAAFLAANTLPLTQRSVFHLVLISQGVPMPPSPWHAWCRNRQICWRTCLVAHHDSVSCNRQRILAALCRRESNCDSPRRIHTCGMV